MLFALLEISCRFIQLLFEALGFVLSLLGLVQGALGNLFGFLKPLFEISFLSRSLSLGNSGRNWARRIKSEK